jgi:hypothetical protein
MVQIKEEGKDTEKNRRRKMSTKIRRWRRECDRTRKNKNKNKMT